MSSAAVVLGKKAFIARNAKLVACWDENFPTVQALLVVSGAQDAGSYRKSTAIQVHFPIRFTHRSHGYSVTNSPIASWFSHGARSASTPVLKSV